MTQHMQDDDKISQKEVQVFGTPILFALLRI